jgi:DNA topoisomerase-1
MLDAMARLRRSDPSRPGIARRKRGRGFSYVGPDGAPVKDPEVLARIQALVIPPAWTDVWIDPHPNGHIQAVGTDAAGRRQYRYHDEWRRRRDLEKFHRMVDFGRALPEVRRTVQADLGRRGYPREKVLAAGVRLLDIGYFRIGGEEYAEEHEAFGLATLERDHVKVRGAAMHFDYPAKGGQRRIITVSDPEVAPLIRKLQMREGGGSDLLAWRGARGSWVDVRADDVNEYLKALAGDEFSAKDFRTWSATVLACAHLALSSPTATNTARRRLVTAVCRQVSTELGNTPAVCRSSYIDPRIFERHDTREAVAGVLDTVTDPASIEPATRQMIESAVIAVLEEERPIKKVA